ncbi:hypothetical protein JXB12_13590 [candidate division KSB1 bacterium]|nr:hypothetical protein [candidate division KSB1 bacterium]
MDSKKSVMTALLLSLRALSLFESAKQSTVFRNGCPSIHDQDVADT